ncbi:amidohydrolase family protein [Copranaerobaculum intestinale]|uniref:amidohydrolase family protein n=1 Tax=Copranaerobaculum intestinale TaxID=2692629 RepID=UPI00201C8A4F|nr:amidohydrolase family protein [Copranaerobaculum intestinale]
MQKDGIRIAINTDSPVIPEEYLPICAGLAAKAGLGEEAALKAITINAAEILKVDDRIGSIEIGKDADLVITKGNIMEINATVAYTLINGEIVYQGH